MTSTPADPSQLIERARNAAERAYAPYSNFRVGAAVELADGSIVEGCNIENASYGLTICAERCAIHTALGSGHLTVNNPIVQIAVTCLDGNAEADPGSVMPCGACRQVIVEHCTAHTTIIVDGVGSYLPADLLPHAFTLTGDGVPAAG